MSLSRGLAGNAAGKAKPLVISAVAFSSSVHQRSSFFPRFLVLGAGVRSSAAMPQSELNSNVRKQTKGDSAAGTSIPHLMSLQRRSFERIGPGDGRMHRFLLRRPQRCFANDAA